MGFVEYIIIFLILLLLFFTALIIIGFSGSKKTKFLTPTPARAAPTLPPIPTSTRISARAKSVLGAILMVAIAIAAIYAFLLVFVPLGENFIYSWDSPEGFEDNSTYYNISGNCIIMEGVLSLNGYCTIVKDNFSDENSHISFDIGVLNVGKKRVDVTTVFYDSAGRAIDFKQVALYSNATAYRAEIEWIIEKGGYFPVASITVKDSKKKIREVADSLGSVKPKKYCKIETIIKGDSSSIDNLRSPYGDYKWRIINPLAWLIEKF